MKIFVLALLWLFAAGPVAFSQQRALPALRMGAVVESGTNSPVPGASIIFFPLKHAVISDDQGVFRIPPKQLIDSLSVSVIGFDPIIINYHDFALSNQVISLKRKDVELSSVTISATPGDPLRLISNTDIKLRGIKNSQEALMIVPGLFVGQHAGGGKAEQMFLRGFDLDHGTDISIEVDGMPVNMVSHAHGQGYADLHFVIPELIENARFKKGPYYAGKGNLATAGFVDLATRNILPESLLKVEAGMFNTYRGVGMVNLLSRKMREKNQSAYVASEYMYSNGYFENPQDFNRLNLFAKYNGQVNRYNTLIISASTFKSKWNASGQIPERAVRDELINFFGAIDPNEGGNTARTNMNLRLVTNLKNGGQIKNQVYFTRYDFELFSNFTFFNVDSVNGDQIKQKEKRNMTGYNGSFTRSNYAGNLKLTSEVGFSVRFDEIHNSELSRTKNKSEILEPIKLGDIKEINSAMYVDEVLRLSQKFSIHAGIRYDHFNMNYRDKLQNDSIRKTRSKIISPKLGLYYYPKPDIEIYLTSGKGFHSNDTRVAVEAGGRKTLPAAFGADLGTVFKPDRKLIINLAAWYLYLEQEFVYVGDEGIVEPSGRSRRLGLDLSFRYQPSNHFFIDIDANYCRARSVDEPKNENFIPLSPVFTSGGGLMYKNNAGLNASICYRYINNRPANEDGSIVAKGYFVNDAVINYSKEKLEIGLIVHNLFNVRWKETQFATESRLRNEATSVNEIHFTPGTPFSLKISVSYKFNTIAKK